MKIKELVKELCKREGLKSQTSIANVREIVGHLSDLIYNEDGLYNVTLLHTLYMNGQKRAKRRNKK